MTFSAAAVWTLLLATTCWAAPDQRLRPSSEADASVYVPELEDQVDLADVLEQGDQELDASENEAARLQKLASLLSVLRSTLNERQQQQQQQLQHGQAALEENSPMSGGYPALLPLIKDDDKRGSYMSLCHFKICNMGRKRNLPWTHFARV